MSRRIEWAKRALKAVRRLDRPTHIRILAAVDRLAEHDEGDVRRLEGRSDVFRLRVGGWRVIFSFSDDGSLSILRIRPRGDAYKA